MDFLILNRDEAAAEYKNGSLRIINENMLPLYLKNTGNVERWLQTRTIDCHRANARLLKKALRLNKKDDAEITLAVNAVTITDNYWAKPIDSRLSYADVRFNNDCFAKLALTGSYDSFNKAANSRHTKTPELTNTGSFEKCWRLLDGEWWMYKVANHEELFS